MAGTWHCILCKADQDTEIEAHIAERHSSPEPHKRIVNGQDVEITDAQYVRENSAEETLEGEEEKKPKRTTPPVPGIFESLGIKEDDIEGVVTEVVGGGACSDTEAKLVLETIDEFCSFKVDRAHFIISFLEWGFLTGFSESSDDAGGWYVREHVTSGTSKIFVKAADMVPEISEKLKENGLGREFMFRRLGRYLGPEIPKLVSKNKSLSRFEIQGTPISQRMGIPPALFLTCTSIFDSIKPFNKWSKDELKSFMAHNASVKKVSRSGQKEFQPQDLRIDPEMAQRLREEGSSDFSRRYQGRFANSEDFDKASKGQEMYDRMLAQSNSRFGMGTAGLGFGSTSSLGSR